MEWCDWQRARQLFFESLEDSNGLPWQGEGFKLNLRKYFPSIGTVRLWNARLRKAGMSFFGNAVGGVGGGKENNNNKKQSI